MKSYWKIFPLLLFAIHTALYSQPVDPLNVSIIPPAPTAAALAKYGLTPVNLSAGIATIDIPLYQVTDHDLTLPISVSYHASGVKVGEIASWVGLGWSLNAGGVITRTVMGLPDEKPIAGFINNVGSISEFLSYTEEDRHEYLQDIADHILDVQPDEFFFNFAGYSGKFITEGIDPQGLLIFRTIPYQNINIVASQQLTSFKIITADGTSYLFNNIELTRATTVCEGGGDEQIDENIKSAWYLESITSAKGTIVTFDYADGSILYYATTSETRLEDPWLYCTDHDTECSTEIEIALKRLQAINFSEGAIKFYAETEREDAEYDYALSRIEIVNLQNEVIKSFSLQYDYHPTEPNFCNDRECKRLMLKELIEKGKDGTALPAYNFEYDPTPLPPRNSKAQDHWGYYNGALSNQTLVPAYPGEECKLFNGAAYGANRLPDFNFSKAAILKSIQYPTGGYALFTYEGNRFGRYMDEFGIDTFDANEIPRIAMSAFASSNGVNSTKPADTFFVNADQTIKIATSIGFGNPPCECEASVMLTNSSGGVLFERGTTDNYENCLFLTPGTYYLSAEMIGSGTAAHATITAYYYERQDDTIKSILAGGVRIEEVRLRKNNVDTLDDQVVHYSYHMAAEPERSSGFLLSTIVYDYAYTTRGFSEISGPGTLCNLYARTSNSQLPIYSSNGNPVFYPEVTEILGKLLSNGSGSFGRKLSVFSFAPNIGVVKYPFAPPINNEYKRGLLINEKTYNSDNQLQIETSNKYEFEPENHFHSITGLKVAYSINDQMFQGIGADEFKFTFYFYPTQWVHQNEQVTTEHFQDGSQLATVKKYFYDNPEHIQVTREQITRSNGIEEMHIMRYPSDYGVFNYLGSNPMLIAIDSMVNKKHIHNAIVEEYKYILRKKSLLKANTLNNVAEVNGGILDGGIKYTNGSSGGVNQSSAKLNAVIDTLLVEGSLTKFKMSGTKVVQDTIFQLDLKEPLVKSTFKVSMVSNNIFLRDTRYRCIQKFDLYNDRAQPLQFHEPFGSVTSVIYENPSGLIGAIFKNANFSDVAYTGFENDYEGQFSYPQTNVASESITGPVSKTISGSRYFNLGFVSHYVPVPGTYVLSFWSTTATTISGTGFTMVSTVSGETISGFTFYQYHLNFNSSGSFTLSGTGKLDELQFYPESATGTTYSYLPLIGLTEIGDENGYMNHFEYNNLNRFQYAEDHFGNGLSFTDYHYHDENNLADHNYIRTEIASASGVAKAALTAATLPNTQSRRSINFLDGLGRPIQMLDCGQSPSGKDIVTYITYDASGRQPRNYLPYTSSLLPGQFKSSAFDDQLNFYSSAAEIAHTGYPFTETEYENSPLNRVTKEANPGEEWKLGSHNIQYNYRSNYINEVHLFVFSTTSSNSSGASFYPAGTLSVKETTDENDNISITYQDKKGKTILEKNPKSEITGPGQKQFNFNYTYYVYDDLERLVQVITPEGYSKLASLNNYTVSSSNDLWNFFYQYNKRGLISAKKLPGIDWSYYIYDQLNRVILTQDPNLRKSNKWSYQKYDGLKRSISSGLTTITGKTPSQLQDERWLSSAICNETRSNTSNGYTNFAYPKTALDELSLNYYDDYDFNNNGTSDYTSNNSQTARSRNKLTGQFSKVLNSMPAVFEKSVSFYDYKGRVIETMGNNYEDEAESETFAYSFSGELLQQERIHHYTVAPVGGGLGISTELTRKTRNEYDHAGRVKNTFLEVDGQPEIWTTSLTYNELGQLLKQKLHNQSIGTGTVPIQKSMQTLDYKYNIRGWVTSINNLENVKDNGDYWGMELHYTDGYPLLDAAAQFAGNISWMAWKSNHDPDTRVYGYSYDPLNRLTKARYGTAIGVVITEADQYTVDNLSYDDNGNIKTMNVHGAISYNQQTQLYTYGISDQLNYSYKGNQLKAVSDAGSLVTWDKSPDFKDTPGENDYGYDVNGNLVNDGNKAIAISYNHLNLPSLIAKSSDQLKITYNANGAKLQEETTENLQTNITGYFGDIIHEEGKPQKILFTDGYLLKDTLDFWMPYYYIKDHLGNIRVVFKGQGLNWTKSNLTFELNADEEGNKFPKFKNVSTVRNNEVALQGNSSGKLFNTEGPYTEIPVKSGDTLEVSVYYYYSENNPQKEAPPKDHGHTPFRPSFSFEMQTLPHKAIPADDANYINKPPFGLQLNIVGLFELFSRKKNNSGNALRTDSTSGSPDAYLELSLRDTANQEINQWRIDVDTANNWSRITDSIGIHVSDSTQQYILRVSLHNESEQDIWFDTLFLKLGTQINPVIQFNHYYPYGNLIADISWQQENSDTNNYLYNGKELHRSLNLNWLDYGARWYDPQVGRWWVVDPMAEAYLSWTAYSYVLNNPIIGVDPNGMFFLDSKERKVAHEKANRLGGNYEKIGHKTFKVNYGFTEYDKEFNTSAVTSTFDIISPGERGRISELEDHLKNSEVQIVVPGSRWGPQNSIDRIEENGIITEVAIAVATFGTGNLVKAGISTTAKELAITEGRQTIIGEGMKRVSVAAIQNPGSIILENMPTFIGTKQQISGKIMAYNRKWILRQMRSGRPIIDIGLDPTRGTPSIFYQMEQNMIKNYLNLHPNAFQIIKQ
ncbi:MAG: DUF6443 domain-containing protein [Chitinophagales bacterium]